MSSVQKPLQFVQDLPSLSIPRGAPLAHVYQLGRRILWSEKPFVLETSTITELEHPVRNEEFRHRDSKTIFE